MKYFSARSIKNSDFASDDFIRLNNCGAFIDTVRPVVTKRHCGRSDYQLIYISQGSISFTINGEKKVLGKGNVILFRPGEPQIYETTEIGTSFYWIHFTGSKVAELLDFFREFTYNIGDFYDFEEFCIDAVKKYASFENAALFCAGRLISLIALLSGIIELSQKQSGKKQFENVLLDMHTNFDIWRSNDEYAAMCGMSKSHFIREFHRTFGSPPQKYRSDLLIEEAKRLLARGFSVKDTADCFGFDDVFYFSRLFKKSAGVSPSKYKK
ncbi:MAG: AraC family transcriptional regulator [Ruminococcaceae bacterium]|nr:AraC family transcriptional regulator [Oscillospiraceae bacterium]